MLNVEEAFDKSDGLLMEYLSLLLSGARLHDVVAAQVRRYISAGDDVSLDALRYICAAHVAGVTLSAEAVGTLLHGRAVTTSLAKLQDEHLIVSDGQEGWRGLHERRSQAILDRLLETPPPTLAAIFRRLMEVVPTEDQAQLVRHYATRTAMGLDGMVDSVTAAIRSRQDVLKAAKLIDALQYGAAFRHARDVRDLVVRVPWLQSSDLTSMLNMLVADRFFGVRIGDSMPPAFRILSDQLPEPPPIDKQAIAEAVRSAAVVDQLCAAPVEAVLDSLISFADFDIFAEDDAYEIYGGHAASSTEQRAFLCLRLATSAGLTQEGWRRCFRGRLTVMYLPFPDISADHALRCP